jgi:hypothetical protein
MVNDQEPRYRLVDAGGNVVGSFFVDGSGNLVMQEATNNNEIVLDNTGTASVPGVETDEIGDDGSGDVEFTSPVTVSGQTSDHHLTHITTLRPSSKTPTISHTFNDPIETDKLPAEMLVARYQAVNDGPGELFVRWNSSHTGRYQYHSLLNGIQGNKDRLRLFDFGQGFMSAYGRISIGPRARPMTHTGSARAVPELNDITIGGAKVQDTTVNKITFGMTGGSNLRTDTSIELFRREPL